MKTAPHKCPVCEGKGRVAIGYYPDSSERTECRSCDGKGVLWGWEEEGVKYVPMPYPVYPQPYPVYPTPIYPRPWYQQPIIYGTVTVTSGGGANEPVGVLWNDNPSLSAGGVYS